MTYFDLSPFDKPAIVQEKKKYATFTVREIGGPAEIIKWRAEQAKKESIYLASLDAREARRVVAAKELGTLDAPALGRPSWNDRMAAGKKMREDYMRPDPNYVPIERTYEVSADPKQSLFQIIGGWFSRLWKSANF